MILWCPDPYTECFSELSKGQALESKLWELTVLQNHYHNLITYIAGQLDKKDFSSKAKTADIDIESVVAGMPVQNVKRSKLVFTASYAHIPNKLFDPRCTSQFPGIQLFFTLILQLRLAI
jgi:hypothetical protein